MNRVRQPSKTSAPVVAIGDVKGITTPRISTPPLRELTPETSYGYDVIEFSRDVLKTPLDPWQEWVAIRIGELLEDGRPRFRTVLLVVSRQNGKSLLGKAFLMYWLFIQGDGVALGTSTDRSYAKKMWEKILEDSRDNDLLAPYLSKVVRSTGNESIGTTVNSEYTFAANNGRAGRSMTLTWWLCDELREHRSSDAWDAASNAMNAVRDAQILAITNQGDAQAQLLHGLRDSALEFIKTGYGDPRLGLFEWSAPDGADPEDITALAQANPNLGYRIDPEALLAKARQAKQEGGDRLTGFRTEAMCQRVTRSDPAIEPALWEAAATESPLDLAQHRDNVTLCLDVSLDGQHASLVAAALVDGIVHVEVVEAWDGPYARADLRRDLRGWIRKISPRVFGWIPNGPAASVAAELSNFKPPRGTVIEEIRNDTMSMCMGFAELVSSGQLRHPNEDLLNQHVVNTTPLWRGDGWVFARRGRSAIDAAYAAAGAVHLARTLPPVKPKLAIAWSDTARHAS